MNKYQEALIYFCNGCHHEYEEGEYGQCKRVEGKCKHYKVLQELVDKETPQKVKRISVLTYEAVECPRCQKEFVVKFHKDDYTYCPNCGQKLDWEVENENE